MARLGSSVLLALSLCKGGLAQISAGGTNCTAHASPHRPHLSG